MTSKVIAVHKWKSKFFKMILSYFWQNFIPKSFSIKRERLIDFHSYEQSLFLFYDNGNKKIFYNRSTNSATFCALQ